MNCITIPAQLFYRYFRMRFWQFGVVHSWRWYTVARRKPMMILNKLQNRSQCASMQSNIMVRSDNTAEDGRNEPLLHTTEVSYVAVNDVAGMKLLGCSMPFPMPFSLHTVQSMFSFQHLRSFVNRILRWGQQKFFIRTVSAPSSDFLRW